MVYFITSRCSSCGHQLLKVGKADNVDQRFHFLRRENAPELTLIGSIPGDEELEREIHAELGESMHNEWFPYDEVAQEIVSRYLQESMQLPEFSSQSEPI
jgi:T5orf172 domain